MKTYILTIALILPVLVFGQLDRSVRPAAAPAPTINIEDSEVFKTENGITVILSENHKLPRVSFQLQMSATPQLEGAQAGLADISGSLIMSGTTNRTKDELDSESDYIGARLNAGLGSMSLSCLKKHMDKGLTLMSDVLMNANFPKSEVDRIIKQNESGLLSTKSDPSAMAQNALVKANFPNHPFGEVMTEESLANISREDIVSYYKRVFTPMGSYLVIVGDINRAEAEEAVNTYFGTWAGTKPNSEEIGTSGPIADNRVLFVKKPGAVQSVVSVTFPMNIDPGHEDYLKLKVLNGVLGGGAFGNRLMQNLREDKAYTYGCRSSISVTENGSWFTAGGNFRNDVTDSAITQILFELERITTGLVEDDEINLTKSSMAGSFARSLESPSTIARFALSIIKNDLPKDYYQTYLKQLDAITKEDLLAVAKKYLTAKQCNIVVVGNEEILDKLTVFDADGKIEKLDAFGNEVKETLPADITADELLSKYVMAVTGTDSEKATKKKLKKIKSYKEVVELNMSQAPFPISLTRVWMAENQSGEKMEGQGMVFQRSYFDGEKGATTSMQGGTKMLTAEEIAAKQKSTGFIPEMNYATSGMTYELLGIEERDGQQCYALKLDDGDSETYEYFEKTTFNKIASVSISEEEGETTETTISYSAFKEQDGFIYPTEMNISMGEIVFSGKVVSRTYNEKIDFATFK